MADMPRGWKIYVLTWAWIGILVGVVNESTLAAFIVWAIGASAGWLIAQSVRDFGWQHAGSRAVPYVVAPVLLLLVLAGINGPTENRDDILIGTVLVGTVGWMLWNRRWLDARWTGIPIVLVWLIRTLDSTDAAKESAAVQWTDDTVIFVLLSTAAIGGAVLTIYALAALFRRRHDAIAAFFRPRGEAEQHLSDTRYRCPACSKPTAFRESDGSMSQRDLLRCSDCGHVTEIGTGARPSGGQKVSRISKPFIPQKDPPVIESSESLLHDFAEFRASMELFAFDDGRMLLESAEVISAETLAKQGKEAPVIKLVNVLLMSAIEKGASDIHIEPCEKELRVGYSVDGILYNIMSPPLKFRDAITSCIKTMSKLDVKEKRLVQEGRLKTRFRDNGVTTDIDFLVSCQPTPFGEKIVMRLQEVTTARSGSGMSAANIGDSSAGDPWRNDRFRRADTHPPRTSSPPFQMEQHYYPDRSTVDKDPSRQPADWGQEENPTAGERKDGLIEIRLPELVVAVSQVPRQGVRVFVGSVEKDATRSWDELAPWEWVLNWMRNEGDSVLEGEPLAVVVGCTGTTAIDVSSPVDGVLVRIVATEGVVLPGSVLGFVKAAKVELASEIPS